MRALGLVATTLITSVLASHAKAEDWEVTVTPYVWLAFPQGDVKVLGARGGGGGGRDEPFIDTEFNDVKLSGVFTGSAEARYQQFGALADLTYYEIESDSDITVGPLPAVGGKVKVSGTKGFLVGYWRAYDDETSSIDLFGGVHYLRVQIKANVITADAEHSARVEKDLWDPVIGVRGKHRFGERFGVSGLATYGGGGSSESLYELQGYLTYRFTDSMTGLAGYRYYSTEWDGRLVEYDTSFSGPLIGVNFAF